MLITSFELVELNNILVRKFSKPEDVTKSVTHIPFDDLSMVLGSLLQGENYILLEEELFEALSIRSLNEITMSKSKIILCRNGAVDWLNRTYYFIIRNHQLVKASYPQSEISTPDCEEIYKSIFEDWNYNNIRKKANKK